MTLQYETPLTGATITVAGGVDNLVIEPAGAIASLHVIFPPSPADDDEFCIVADKQVNSTALSTSDGSAVKNIYGATFLEYSTGASRSWVYAATPNAWFNKA